MTNQYPMSVLIVDDEPDVVEVLGLIVEKKTDKIFTAGNGLEALKILKNERVDIVLADIMMPKMGGIEILKKIREVNDETIFIFVTGNADLSGALETIHLGVFDMITKPFDNERIEKALDAAIVKRTEDIENMRLVNEFVCNRIGDKSLDDVGEEDLVKFKETAKQILRLKRLNFERKR